MEKGQEAADHVFSIKLKSSFEISTEEKAKVF